MKREVPEIDSSQSPSFLSGGGELGALMRQQDWSATPLGPSDAWPLSLRTAVRIMLTSRQPMFIWWGLELINLYNDPYRSILGGKHPGALGMPASVVWKEIWDQVGPRAHYALSMNEGTYDEALLLIMERNGYPEETYYTFSYSPLPNDEGATTGIFCANSNDTQRIIGGRQLALQREIGARVTDSRTAEEACRRITEALGTNRRDLPFALLYLVDDDRQIATLAGSSGFLTEHPAAPASVDMRDQPRWPLDRALSTHTPQLLYLDQSAEPLPRGDWDVEPAEAIVVPINSSGQTARAAVLVAGLSPYRLFDDAYRDFIDLISNQIAAGLANAQAYEQERKRAEALAELDRAKTTFFSNVSHEFRTPLTLMLGPLEDLLSKDAGALGPDQMQSLSLVHRNGLRLQKLVNALLEFSRIEAGRVRARFEATELGTFTADLAASFASAMARAQLEFSCECRPLSKPVYVDRSMWERIILNLLSNALKYTLQGSVSVRLTEEDGQVKLSVSDTGTGIPAAELPHLFERFHRVEGAKARTLEGTGIGLALVYELVRLHGGMVGVSSEVDKGSTFTVKVPFTPPQLPVQTSEDTPQYEGKSVTASAYLQEALEWLPEEENATVGADLPNPPAFKTGSGRPRILLADDNADMRNYVNRLLSQEYDVIAVSNGLEALRVALEQRPDLVVSDIMMPEMNGFELLQSLRTNSNTASTPVLFLSARAGEEASAEGREAGADDYIVKPFTARELLSRVRGTLLSQKERQLANKYLSDLFAQAPTAIAVLRGREMIFELANQAYEGLVPGRVLRGRSFFDVLPEVRPEVREALGNVYETGMPYVANEWAIPYDADEDGVIEDHWFNLVFQPFRSSEAPRNGVIIVCNEVTAQVRAREELERANRQLEEFAFVASHDLQEPLRMVNSYSQLLVKRFEAQPSEQAKICLKFISGGVRRMEELIQDLLSFARVVQTEPIPGTPVNLQASLERALELLRPQSEEKNAVYDIGPLPTVLADDLQSTQLWQNLLSNSLKYSREGVAPVIHIGAQRDDGLWIISCRDNGIGFRQEYAEHIFGLFKRLHRNEYPGTGLGLAICKRIVERAGGRIWAESEPDKGATFYFSLPAVETSRDQK